jgi:hypothetical protein
MSFIQNLFTSRDNNANAVTYVGQQDRIWWDPVTNAFYYSDGNTAGGIPIGSSSGNGMPHGPTNSVQLNSGNGTFLGSSSLVFSSNVLAVVGNTTANFFIGDGGLLSNINGANIVNGYGNSNVAAYLPTYGGNFTANYISAVGNVTASGGNTIIDDGVSTTGNVTGANIVTLGNVTANNVLTNNYLYANGQSIFANTTFTGNVNLGNLYIIDETIYGKVADRDIVLDAAGNGVVNINGPFHIHSGNLTSNPIFQVDLDGRVKTLVPNTSAYNGAFNIVGSTNGAESVPQNPGVMLHATGQPTIPGRIYNDGVSNYAAIINRRYNGISSAPTGVLQNQIMGRLGATPYLVDDSWPSISTTRLDMVALEDQTTTAQGSAIKLYTVPIGNINPTTTAEFVTGQITMYGNLNPALDDTYSLGNAAYQWQGLYLGNSGVSIKDAYTGNNAQLTVNSGVLSLTNVTQVQVGNIQLTTTGLVSTVSTQDIVIGTVGDSGNTVINNAGIKFTNGSIQTTAAIPLVQRGNANGVATLGSDGLVPISQLPAGAVVYKGTWDAGNNTPFLTNGVGTAGWEYSVSVPGTVNFGAGNITFFAGDFVIYSGSLWQQIAGGGSGVTSFNSRTGAVTLTSGDVTNALNSGSIVNSKLANAGINITYSSGISGNASVNLGGTLALTNSGVTGITAGTGVTASAATGNVTVSIGQAVGTANSVTFQAITSNTTVAASGNVTGGNLATGGQVVATGNILTSGQVSATGNITTAGYFNGDGGFISNITPGTKIVNGTSYANIASSGGNLVVVVGGNTVETVTSTGANITGYASVSGNVTGGNILSAGLISTTGNATHSNVSATGNIADANGLLRSLPINTQGSAYQLTATDNGNLISISSGNVTVPASVFVSPFGQAITVYNNSGTTRYITQPANVTLRLAGTAATGNRTLAQYGLATIVCVSANTFVVSGVGLS